MDTLIQKPTDCAPKVIFSPNGNLLIEGRSFSENPNIHFEPLVEFCNKLKAEEVILDIKMDYLNTASSKCLYKVLEALEENSKLKQTEVRWFCEEDDEDMIELGDIYAEMCERVMFTNITIGVNSFVV